MVNTESIGKPAVYINLHSMVILAVKTGSSKYFIKRTIKHLALLLFFAGKTTQVP
jgi:hypothetical protein